MKKVFSNHSEVCHIWAQQNQLSGRANNIFFEGDVIYSYGYHYRMAKFHNTNGALVLINSSGYSSSTGKHTSHVRSAISHLESLSCPNVDPQNEADHAENVKYFVDAIEHAQKKQARARSNAEFWIDQAQGTAQAHNKYLEYFNLIEAVQNV